MLARPPAFRAPRDWIEWPFFDASHREFATRLDRFVDSEAVRDIDHNAVDAACRKLVRSLGEAGLLEAAVPSPDGDASGIDSRAVCLARETLAWRDGLTDFAFAMQGLGSGAIAIAGSPELRGLSCPKRGRVNGLRPSHCRRSTRVPTWRPWPARRVRMATTMSSMARKLGFPMAASQTSTRCLPEPAKRRAPAGFRRSSSFPMIQASQSPSGSM